MSDDGASPLGDIISEHNEENEENGDNHNKTKNDSIGDLDSRKSSQGDDDNNDKHNDDDDNLDEISYNKPGYDDQEEDMDDGRGSRSRGDVGIKGSKTRKKLKKTSELEGSNDESGADAQDYENDNDEDNDNRKRNDAKKGKRPKNKLDDETVQNECAELIAKMDVAYKIDIECNKKKTPALQKLKTIGEVAQILRKPQMQERFLNDDGLDKIAMWLQKMPDGSLPGQTLKKKLIDVINILPVNYDHVNKTTLGKQLYELFKNPKEDSELKKELKNIIDRWSRIALMMPLDYSYASEEYRDDRGSKKKSSNFNIDDRDNNRQEKIKSLFFNPLKAYDRKDLNKRVGYNYTVMPQGLNEKDFKAKSTGSTDYEKMMNDFKRKKKKL